MKFRTTTILLTLAWVAAAPAPAQGQIVSAQVDTRSTIYAGWSFSYYIVINGAGQPGQVDLTPLSRFRPRAAGNQSQNLSGVQRFIMMYTLTANTAGTITVPAVPVTINGQTYRTNPVTVSAVAPRESDALDLEVTLSRQQCYVGQPVTLTARFFVDETIDLNDDVRDLRFNVFPLASDDFLVEDADVADPQAKLYRLDSELQAWGTQQAVSREGRRMTRFTFSKLLIPKRSGRIDLQNASVLIELATGVVRTDDFFNPFQTKYELFAVHADPPSLEVLPLPEASKPAEFYGLVGGYTISASAAPTQVNVGDPITLTIRVGGNPYLKAVPWPDLEGVPMLAQGFKIPAEKASPVIENGEKVFTQTVRANSDSVTQVPPIPLAYFDPDAGKYVVVRTKPIPLEVAPTKVLTTADVESTAVRPAGREIQAIREGFAANYYGYDVLADQAFSPLKAATSPGYLVLWSVPLAALIASAAFQAATRKSPEAIAGKRRRQAAGKALRELKGAGSVEPARRPELLVAALKTYLGDRFDRVAGSLTADDCRDVIAAATDDAPLADRFRAKVCELEAARYASLDANVDAAQIEDAIDLIRRVERESKR